MNKKLAAFYAEQGLSTTGNRAYGIVRGYEVNVALLNGFETGAAAYGVGGLAGAAMGATQGGGAMPCQVHFSFYATDEQKQAILAIVQSQNMKFCRAQATQYGMSVGVSYFFNGQLAGRLAQIFGVCLDAIAQNGGLTSEYCPVCGNPIGENKQACTIDRFTICIDAECVERINAAIEADNKAFDAAPNNYLRGFFGALIGSLAGAVVAIILYAAGFISAIASIVSVLLGSFLYKAFKGKPNKMMLVIVSLTTVVCMVLSIFLIYLAAAGIAATNEGLAISAFEAFRIVMQDATVARAFYADLAMVLLFSAIGIVVHIVYAAQAIKRKKSIK